MRHLVVWVSTFHFSMFCHPTSKWTHANHMLNTRWKKSGLKSSDLWFRDKMSNGKTLNVKTLNAKGTICQMKGQYVEKLEGRLILFFRKRIIFLRNFRLLPIFSLLRFGNWRLSPNQIKISKPNLAKVNLENQTVISDEYLID